MGFFKEKICAHCGKKAGMLKSTLKDGQYICSKCTKPVPFELNGFLKEYDYEGFKDLLEYLEKYNKEYKAKFCETHRYHSIHLDAQHGLFYLDDISPRVYFRVQELEEFKLDYRPETFKEGFFCDKVNGDVYLKLKVNFPYMIKDAAVAKNQKANATTKGVFGKKVVFDNPKGMDTFYLAALDCWGDALEAETRELEQLMAQTQELCDSLEKDEESDA